MCRAGAREKQVMSQEMYKFWRLSKTVNYSGMKEMSPRTKADMLWVRCVTGLITVSDITQSRMTI